VSTMPFILADVDFPDVYDRIMSTVSVVNLAINEEAIVSCSSAAQYDYVTKLVIGTTYPMAIVLLLWLCCRVHLRYVCGVDNSSRIDQRKEIVLKYEEAVLVLSIVILPSGMFLASKKGLLMTSMFSTTSFILYLIHLFYISFCDDIPDLLVP
jgi:hypothetical protein